MKIFKELKKDGGQQVGRKEMFTLFAHGLVFATGMLMVRPECTNKIRAQRSPEADLSSGFARSVGQPAADRLIRRMMQS